jgi:hypothetical protein
MRGLRSARPFSCQPIFCLSPDIGADAFAAEIATDFLIAIVLKPRAIERQEDKPVLGGSASRNCAEYRAGDFHSVI